MIPFVCAFIVLVCGAVMCVCLCGAADSGDRIQEAAYDELLRAERQGRFTHWPDGTEVEVGNIDDELAELLS